jgi:hypothetical protein
MGIFSGANALSPATNGSKDREDLPFFLPGQRRVSIRRALLRKSTNESSRNYKQFMVIVEFDVLETFSGEEQTGGKVIETLQRDPDGDLTKAGAHAVSRVMSLIAAACGLDEVGEEALDTLFPLPEAGKFSEAEALQGLEVVAVTTTFDMKGGGSFTPTVYEAIG